MCARRSGNILFYFHFLTENFSGSKDTAPYKTDVSFLCQCMVKTFKNLLLQNPKADDLETWYAASDARVLSSLFK